MTYLGFHLVFILPPVAALALWLRARPGALLYLAVAVAGGLMLLREETTYFGLILAWAAPVLAGQWAYAGGEIWRHRQAWALGVAAPTLYLWVADAIAIRLGIWDISDRYTVGLRLWTLPLEEAVFFLATNLLVVQGLILFLHPPGRVEEEVVGRRSSVVGLAGAGPVPRLRHARRTTDD